MERNNVVDGGRRSFLARLGVGLVGVVAVAATGGAVTRASKAPPAGLPSSFPRWEPASTATK